MFAKAQCIVTSATPILANAPVARRDADAVATLTLDNPASRNALSMAMIDCLRREIGAVGADPAVRAIVVTANGPAFSAGHDLKEIQAHRGDGDQGRAYFEALMSACSALMHDIASLSTPVIAAVEGVATAAGCQLVAACDLAVAGENARFATPGVNIGLFCSTPLVAIGRAVASKRAMEMALTGALYGARDAERFGLVNRVVAAGAAYEETMKLARAIAARSAATIAIGKRAFYAQRDLDLADAYELASKAMVANLLHPDSDEGIGAFLERREPQWRSP
jgi:enoyl-CoA hydratase/carnithine racemase